LTQTTPKSPDMQDIYFPPPPLSAGRRSRGSGRFSIMPRQVSKNSDEENVGQQLLGTSLQQRTWPRYYPIMPDQSIGIATTTSYPQPVAPVQPTTYTPVSAPVSAPTSVNIGPSPAVSRNSSISTIPAYQPHNSYRASVVAPQLPPAVHVNNSRTGSQGSKRSSRQPPKSRQSTFSFMTDIEEGAQISSSEASMGDISGNSSCESVTSSRMSATSSTKKARRPTLTINIPGQAQSRPTLPPPPAQKPPSRALSVIPGPPAYPPPSGAPSNAAAPAPQALPSRAPSVTTQAINQTVPPAPPSETSGRPIRQPSTKAPWKPAAPSLARPPLLRENYIPEIANSPKDILAAASSYASARKTSSTPSRESASSAALPSSEAMAGSTFLLSDSERNSSSRSNSSVRRPSRTPSRLGSRRGSDASCTSFEDDGEESEDETPPKEENKRLSPVHESHQFESSPVSTLRYPKVPRSAGQAVPRSPGTPKRNGIDSPQALTPNRLRPEVDTARAAAITQGIGNRLWKTELSPQGKPMPTPEWAAHRRSESWQSWAQNNTPEASSASTLPTPQRPFANSEGPRLTPTKRGDELFLEMRF
jgi:hypothetical protein